MNLIDGWQHARNVLCVRLDAMGDVLMTDARPPRRAGGPPAIAGSRS